MRFEFDLSAFKSFIISLVSLAVGVGSASFLVRVVDGVLRKSFLVENHAQSPEPKPAPPISLESRQNALAFLLAKRQSKSELKRKAEKSNTRSGQDFTLDQVLYYTIYKDEWKTIYLIKKEHEKNRSQQ